MKHLVFSFPALLGTTIFVSSCNQTNTFCTETKWYVDGDGEGFHRADGERYYSYVSLVRDK